MNQDVTPITLRQVFVNLHFPRAFLRNVKATQLSLNVRNEPTGLLTYSITRHSVVADKQRLIEKISLIPTFDLLLVQQRHHIAVLRHDFQPCRSHFICLHGKSGVAKVPQQDLASQLPKVRRQPARVSALLHEVRPRGRHVHDADM